MDETFQLRAKRMLGTRQQAALDYEVLTATLISQQATTPELLAETLLGGLDWQDAATAQPGCFNRAEVKRRRNAP